MPDPGSAPSPGARVSAVSRAPAHTFSKPDASGIRVVAGHGVEGDAHAGRTVQHRSRVARNPDAVAGVHSGSALRAQAIGARSGAGMVHIDDQIVNDEVVAPFGGRGDSGGGTFGALTNLGELTTWQWVTVRDSQSTPPG